MTIFVYTTYGVMSLNNQANKTRKRGLQLHKKKGAVRKTNIE